ncbi:MAG: dTMP kinase [Actinomycetota bacterium]|nr:dTMP kinase [Actinomycetota bacterium]
MSGSISDGHDLRAVLRVRPFRQLWVALTLSSLGDWIGLLATTALASSLYRSYSAQSYAIGGVLIVRLAPAVVLGPFAGAFADRFDRRRTMVVADCLRFALFASIPLVRRIDYLLVASFLIESVGLFWIPAKEASVPNLVPRERLEAANQLSLITTYGSAPLGAAIFTGLSLLNSVLASGLPFFHTNPVDVALYFDALTFLFSAATIFRLREITGAPSPREPAAAAVRPGVSAFLRSITEGWQFVGQTPLVRGVVIGIIGAFSAGGVIIATGKLYVTQLGGGNAAYGVLFGAVFLGLATGMLLGPRVLADFSRRRLSGLAIVLAGLSLALMAVLPNLVLVLFAVISVGAWAGVAWVTGYTLLGLEVADEVRGRTFASLQSLVRIDLLAVLSVTPFLVGLIGRHSIHLGHTSIRLDGVTLTLLGAGLLAAGLGVVAFRQMDDRPGVPLVADLLASVRGETGYPNSRRYPGLFVAVEGGEGAGKSTQVALLVAWLRERGCDVVTTREPGATAAGAAVRALLLDPATGTLAPRAEALLYAADRAEHVERVIRPALDRGAVVVTDRYVDSSLAYQGAGRNLPPDEVARLSRWATEGLTPDLTVLLDVDPALGLRRLSAAADRIEAESLEFHQRVRSSFLALADRSARRYLVVPADDPPELVSAAVRERLESLLATLPAYDGATRDGATRDGATGDGATEEAATQDGDRESGAGKPSPAPSVPGATLAATEVLRLAEPLSVEGAAAVTEQLELPNR